MYELALRGSLNINTITPNSCWTRAHVQKSHSRNQGDLFTEPARVLCLGPFFLKCQNHLICLSWDCSVFLSRERHTSETFLSQCFYFSQPKAISHLCLFLRWEHGVTVWCGPMCSGFLTAKGQDSERCVCSESGGEQGILLQGHWDVGFKRVALPIKIIRFIYISTDKTSLWGERNMCKRTDKQAEKSDCWKGWWVEQTADCSCNKVLEEGGSSREWLRGQHQRHHLEACESGSTHPRPMESDSVF